MARSSWAICACAFFLVLILCHQFVSVEGRRHLKRKKFSKQVIKNTLSNVAKGGVGITESRQAKASKVAYVEDFRPTAPGHSPGVGHSIKN